MKLKYSIRKKKPICLHALGQPLVDAVWLEATALLKERDELANCLFHLEKELQLAFDDVPSGVDAWMATARTILAKVKGDNEHAV